MPTAARTIIKQMTEASAGRKFLLDDVMCFWDQEADKKSKESVSLVGLIKNNDRIDSFGFCYQKFMSDRFGQVMLCGTGSHAVADIIANLGPPPDNFMTINILEKAVSTALRISTQVLADEIITNESLFNYFGGGIELLSLVKGRFTKLSDITYLIWYVEEDNSHNIRFSYPDIALKFTYHGDNLLIRRGEFEAGKEALQIKGDDFQVYVIEPIIPRSNRLDNRDIPIPSFNSKWACHYVLIRRDDGTLKLRYLLNYVANGNYGFKFIEEKNLVIRMEYNENFLKELHKSVVS